MQLTCEDQNENEECYLLTIVSKQKCDDNTDNKYKI